MSVARVLIPIDILSIYHVLYFSIQHDLYNAFYSYCVVAGATAGAAGAAGAVFPCSCELIVFENILSSWAADEDADANPLAVAVIPDRAAR